MCHFIPPAASVGKDIVCPTYRRVSESLKVESQRGQTIHKGLTQPSGLPLVLTTTTVLPQSPRCPVILQRNAHDLLDYKFKPLFKPPRKAACVCVFNKVQILLTDFLVEILKGKI